MHLQPARAARTCDGSHAARSARPKKTAATSPARDGIENPIMNIRAALMLTLAAAVCWCAWQRFEHRPVQPPNGRVAPAEPRQTDIKTATALAYGRWRLTPRAHYEVTARILGRESYHFDALADLVPEDLALGWGPMSDSRILAAFKISQAARFYVWRPLTALPIPREDVIAHSANTHVIPADERIRSRLAQLRVGEVVRLTGTLVDATRDDGAFLRTSLSRTDSGAGACEVLLVERLEGP
jgi:hypothetical protein